MPASSVLLFRVVLFRETTPGVTQVLMWPGPPDQVISKPPRATTPVFLALKALMVDL